ncbi:MAG: METTL5 family protein [Thermoplasmata archaeon]|nr:METTL5 family protein [Thermoplasmata archaeon]
MRRPKLVQFLSELREFPRPDPAWEQVATPPEAAADLLLAAYARGDLLGCTVLDLGSGTGRLALGAAWLGATTVVGVEVDAEAVEVARANSEAHALDCQWVHSSVLSYHVPADTVLMNPPFGAQRRHADRPFWDRALTLARRSVYAFSLAQSRNFIGHRAVAHGARIDDTRPVPWELPATFPHHRKPRIPLSVDGWVLRVERGSTP